MNYQQAVVGGFILNAKGEFLMVKRSDTDDFLPGLWEIPGGGVEFGEHPFDALKRELKEEVGLDVEIGKPLHVDDHFMPIRQFDKLTVKQAQGKNSKIHRVEITFACSLKDANQPVLLSHEHSDHQWVSEDDLSTLEMTDYMRETLRTCFQNM